MKPEISVIIPIFNVEKYVAECLKSVSNQTFTDFEVICVDDGSSDASLEVAKKAVEGDSRFVFLSQENSGQSAARNKGFTQALGNYVIFLDADDYWELDTLEKLYGLAKAEDADDVFFSARTVYDDGANSLYVDEYDKRQSIPGVFTGMQMFVEFAKAESFAVSPVMQFFKREFLETSGITFLEGVIHEDNLFTCQVLIEAQRVAFLNESLYVRRIRQGSTMTQKHTLNHIYGHFKCALELKDWLKANYDQCDQDFIDALIKHIAFCFDTSACDAQEYSRAELVEFAQSLSAGESVEFRLHVVEHAQEVERIVHEYKDSTTFKVGSAILKVPMMFKNRNAR